MGLGDVRGLEKRRGWIGRLCRPRHLNTHLLLRIQFREDSYNLSDWFRQPGASSRAGVFKVPVDVNDQTQHSQDIACRSRRETRCTLSGNHLRRRLNNRRPNDPELRAAAEPVSEETDRQKERRSKTGRDPFPAMIAAPLESMRSPNASIPDHRNGMDAVELPS